MSLPFLITGLPRSKTAWMAVAASTGSSTCAHEPTADLPHWTGVFDLWEAGTLAYTGISDSTLGFHLPEIIETIHPRVLIIERDIEQVEDSLEKLFGVRTNFCPILAGYLRYEHPLIRRVPFTALAGVTTVQDCLKWLMPSAPHPEQNRLEKLVRMNIQTDPHRLRAIASDRSKNLEDLVGPVPAHAMLTLNHSAGASPRH